MQSTIGAYTRISLPAILFLSTGLASLSAQAAEPSTPEETLLLQDPSIGKSRIVFTYARDLWVVPRSGGEARRLTSSSGAERWPQLSPDEKWVAFSAQYEGNADVYLMPITGGTPRRLTWHPGTDIVRDWHPDGKRILFASNRHAGSRYHQFYEVSIEGGTPDALKIPRGFHARYNPAATRIAYTPYYDAFRTWKRYRGGRVTPIWVYDPVTHEVDEVPHVRASDTFPAWTSKWLYFASDRDDRMNLWRYDPIQKRIQQVSKFKNFDVRSIDAHGDTVVFEQGGALHVHDATSGKTERLRIWCRDDGLQRAPRWATVADQLRGGSIAPNGKRAVVEARGEILSVPRERGPIRNLSDSPGAHDRSPTWSPDGKHIAWFSDEGGEYRLAIRSQDGRGKKRFLELQARVDDNADVGGFYFDPHWSPDSKHVLYRDKTNRWCFVTIEGGEVTQISRNEGSLGVVSGQARWSPDSKWIAYESRNPRTLYDSVVLYSVESGASTIVSDGFGNADGPCFSADGKYLFFAASVDRGPRNFGLDMSASAARRGSDSLYYVALRKSTKALLRPRSDEGYTAKKASAKPSKKGDAKKTEDAKAKKANAVAKGEPAKGAGQKDKGAAGSKEKSEKADKKAEPLVDLDGLDQRILGLPVRPGNLGMLSCTSKALLFMDFGMGSAPSLKSFNFDSRKTSTVASGVMGYAVSADRKSLLLAKASGWQIASSTGQGAKTLPVASYKVRVDPAKEWPQILREVWRIERDFFYDKKMHGVDWKAMWARWSPFVKHVRHRADLNLVIGEMIGELACGHEYVSGGQTPRAPGGIGVGLLGCDWKKDGKRYRIGKILRGQNWNARLRAPLTSPGVDAREGDFLFAVDGRKVTTRDNLFEVFQGTSGRVVELSLGSKADGSDKRTVEVVPIANDAALRQRSWVEANRRRVDELSGGRLAYIYMPNTGNEGMLAFDRDYFSQLDRKGVILDERYNGGGKVADYVIDVLSRKVRCYWMNREQWVGKTPFGTIDGPKVMICNEMAGSGGDAMPWMFQKAGLGPIVGNRTWGGLVGISGYPPLMDGGSVTAASFGIMDREGRWCVENEGVTPDHTIIEYPKPIIEGGDPQLEKAVDLALQALKNWPAKKEPVYYPPTKR